MHENVQLVSLELPSCVFPLRDSSDRGVQFVIHLEPPSLDPNYLHDDQRLVQALHLGDEVHYFLETLEVDPHLIVNDLSDVDVHLQLGMKVLDLVWIRGVFLVDLILDHHHAQILDVTACDRPASRERLFRRSRLRRLRRLRLQLRALVALESWSQVRPDGGVEPRGPQLFEDVCKAFHREGSLALPALIDREQVPRVLVRRKDLLFW
mmetsp:Transcript_52750/g.137427  ORF Transcript_52750/g.137427 Transcript_52750/m.137427 type:complete len:208 (+) Transcript_52750:1486-2109(+)